MGTVFWAMRPGPSNAVRRHGILQWRFCVLLSAALAVLTAPGAEAALPKRLVILLDGVAHRDVAALQAGLVETNSDGRAVVRHAFTNGWFPASRLVSTFPSASDVAWTEILGNAPLPGYQRTYFHRALGAEVHQNGVTSTLEYEHQMHWQLESGFRRAFGYLHPHTIFKNEVRELIAAFRASPPGREIFYGLLRASDDAQHTRGDIVELLCFLDAELDSLRAEFRAREGRELELLVLSDHGNNHAGAGTRSPVRTFLREAGYTVAKEVRNQLDVVLPTVGIQSWIEVHCAPEETPALADVLTRLDGADLVTAHAGGTTADVFSAARGRARVEWRPQLDAFRYAAVAGDPLGYAPVIEMLRARGELDGDGFATAEAWERATLGHRYPLAPERIARGHTRLAQNCAPILVSLSNGWIHASWMLEKLSTPMKMGGTHGGLDADCSNGVLLSSFLETPDTASPRVARVVGGFAGRRDPREGGTGARWVSRDIAVRPTASSAPGGLRPPADDEPPALHVWSPQFAGAAAGEIEAAFHEVRRYGASVIRRGGAEADDPPVKVTVLRNPWPLRGGGEHERVYDLPENFELGVNRAYRLKLRWAGGAGRSALLEFRTDGRGRPVIE